MSDRGTKTLCCMSPTDMRGLLALAVIGLKMIEWEVRLKAAKAGPGVESELDAILLQRKELL